MSFRMGRCVEGTVHLRNSEFHRFIQQSKVLCSNRPVHVIINVWALMVEVRVLQAGSSCKLLGFFLY